MSFEQKYLKYKQKYLELKNQIGGNFVVGDIVIDYANKKVGTVKMITDPLIHIMPLYEVDAKLYDTSISNVKKMFNIGDKVIVLESNLVGTVKMITGEAIPIMPENGSLFDTHAWNVRLKKQIGGDGKADVTAFAKEKGMSLNDFHTFLMNISYYKKTTYYKFDLEN